MVFADLLEETKNFDASIELEAMTLPVVKADRLDVLVALERPGEAGGGVLPAGEKDESALPRGL